MMTLTGEQCKNCGLVTTGSNTCIRCSTPFAEEKKPSPKLATTNCSSVGWLVPTYETNFGVALDTGLNGLSILLYRGSHGWKTLEASRTYARLSHQIYEKDLNTVLHDMSVLEICVVDLECGKWKTLWAKTSTGVTHP